MADPTLLARAAELDKTLQLQPGHGIVQIMLAALIADIQAGDYDRILCTWSFNRGEKWAVRKLDQLRQRWAHEDAIYTLEQLLTASTPIPQTKPRQA